MEKLEVVNKKWVRVRLVPGAAVEDAGVSFVFSLTTCKKKHVFFFDRMLSGLTSEASIRLNATWKTHKLK